VNKLHCQKKQYYVAKAYTSHNAPKVISTALHKPEAGKSEIKNKVIKVAIIGLFQIYVKCISTTL